jgi:plastocyanin
MRARLAFAGILAAAVLAPRAPVVGQQTADGGAIRGRVMVSETGRAPTRPSISSLAEPTHDPIDRRHCVVYLASVPQPAFAERKPGRARMDQRNETFVPHLLAITAGTTVDFPNNDTTFHNVFSLSRADPFDLGRYPPGKTGSWRFDDPGIVPVFCDIHSHMNAYILVFNHPFFAVTDDEGRYAIPSVPAGGYTLIVWSELGKAESRKITVVDGETVEAEFRIGAER